MRDYASDKVFSNPDLTLPNKSPNQTFSQFIDMPRNIYSEWKSPGGAMYRAPYDAINQLGFFASRVPSLPYLKILH